MRRAVACTLRIAALATTALLLAPASGVAAVPPFGRVTTIDMPRGRRAESAFLADVDGDGARDLVVAAARGGAHARRLLRVYFRRSGDAAFTQEPDIDLMLLPDVVGIAVADVHPDAGAEIVLFAPTGVFALRWRATEERDRYVQLLAADVLWQLPHHRKTLVLQDFIRDVDGNGLPDLLVPEPSGYRLALQRDGGTERTFSESTLHVPEERANAPLGAAQRRMQTRERGRNLRVSLRIGGGTADAEGGTLLSVAETVPAPQLTDWDGDGLDDVVAQTTSELLVWRQREGEGFAAAPDTRISLPLTVDRRRLLDVSFAAMTADLDGDRRADYVLVAGDQDASEPRAQIAVYGRSPRGDAAARPLFGERGRPSQLLVVAGIAGAPTLSDVDGDGLPDLVLGAIRFDALDALRAVAGSTIDAEMYVYRNERGRFGKHPALTVKLSVPADGLRHSRGQSVARFVGDVTGDGVAELLVRDDPTRLRLFMVRRVRGALSIVDRPLFETVVPDDADVLVTPPGSQPPEVLVLSHKRILHVRLGR